MKQALCAVVAPRQLEQERREVKRLCLGDGRKSSARPAHAGAWLTSGRLLGRYQRCETLIYHRDGRRTRGRLRRGAEGGNPRARKRDEEDGCGYDVSSADQDALRPPVLA